ALPLLKKAGPVNIDENVSEEMIDKPLKATLHLELKANWIIGKLNYYYGNYEINPFSRLENKEVVIIRDVDKERQIMSLIEQAHFHYNGKELYLECSEDEDMYNFLYTIIPVLEDKVDLYLTSDVMDLINEEDIQPEVNVRVEAGTNLLEVGFTIDGVDDEEVNQILQAVIEKKRYYRLQSGALISLEEDEFSSVTNFFTQFNMTHSDLEENNVKLPAYRTTQLDELVD